MTLLIQSPLSLQRVRFSFTESNVKRAGLPDPRPRDRKIKTEKGIRWMPWYYEPMKDAVTSEMLRGGGKQPLIRRCPNGETYICEAYVPLYRGVY